MRERLLLSICLIMTLNSVLTFLKNDETGESANVRFEKWCLTPVNFDL